MDSTDGLKSWTLEADFRRKTPEMDSRDSLQEMDSRDGVWEMDSLDGLWLLIVNCMEERGEDPPGLGQFITPGTFHRPFKCQRKQPCLQLT